MANVSLRHIYKIYDGGVTAVTDFNLEISPIKQYNNKYCRKNIYLSLIHI